MVGVALGDPLLPKLHRTLHIPCILIHCSTTLYGLLTMITCYIYSYTSASKSLNFVNYMEWGTHEWELVKTPLHSCIYILLCAPNARVTHCWRFSGMYQQPLHPTHLPPDTLCYSTYSSFQLRHDEPFEIFNKKIDKFYFTLKRSWNCNKYFRRVHGTR